MHKAKTNDTKIKDVVICTEPLDIVQSTDTTEINTTVIFRLPQKLNFHHIFPAALRVFDYPKSLVFLFGVSSLFSRFQTIEAFLYSMDICIVVSECIVWIFQSSAKIRLAEFLYAFLAVTLSVVLPSE